MLEDLSLKFAATAMVSEAPYRRLLSLAAFTHGGDALRDALGFALPVRPQFIRHQGLTILWSGPDAWLVLVDDPAQADLLIHAAQGHAALTEQGDGRVVFTVQGAQARDALARLVPIDLHQSVFPAGSTALTLAGHVTVQIWLDEEEKFHLCCFRSFAKSLYTSLVKSCRQFESMVA